MGDVLRAQALVDGAGPRLQRGLIVPLLIVQDVQGLAELFDLVQHRLPLLLNQLQPGGDGLVPQVQEALYLPP